MTANRIGSPIEYSPRQDLVMNMLDAAQAAGLQTREYPTPAELAALRATMQQQIDDRGLAEEGGVYSNPFGEGPSLTLKSEEWTTGTGRRYGYNLSAYGGRVNWIVFVGPPSSGESFAVATRQERDWLLAMIRLAGTAA